MNTYYFGIDIGKRFHSVSVIDQEKKQLKRNKEVNNNQKGFEELIKMIKKYQQHGDVKVGCEATGHYWLNLFHYLNKEDIKVSVFNPLQVASFRNTNIRGNKTDSDDGVLIAEVLKFNQLEERTLPTEQLFELKQLTNFRSKLAKQITSVKLQLIQIMDQVFPEFQELFKDICGKTAKEILRTYPHPRKLEEVSLEELTDLLSELSRNQFGENKAKKLKDKAKQTIGLQIGLDTFEFEIKMLLRQLEELEKQIELSEEKIKELVEAQNTNLTTIPGVSHLTAGIILSETMHLNSCGGKSLLAYAGLDPQKKQSGANKGTVKMSKRGNKRLRSALWMAASSARMHSPTFKQVFEKQKARGKHYKVAMSHVAKKMTYTVSHILRVNDVFKEQV